MLSTRCRTLPPWTLPKWLARSCVMSCAARTSVSSAYLNSECMLLGIPPAVGRLPGRPRAAPAVPRCPVRPALRAGKRRVRGEREQDLLRDRLIGPPAREVLAQERRGRFARRERRVLGDGEQVGDVG